MLHCGATDWFRPIWFRPIWFSAMPPACQLTFENGHTATAVWVSRMADLPLAIAPLHLRLPCAVLVVIGGASGLKADALEHLSSLFRDVLCPIVEKTGLTVVDGGTDAGVMQLMGQARAATDSTFPLIGVVAAPKAILPIGERQQHEVDEDAARLEPNHTHFILVPGEEWGDESIWIAEVAEKLSGDRPSATILINGGMIALNQDVPNSLDDGRPVLVISGSGRSADKIAAAIDGEANDPAMQELIDSGLIYAIDLAESPETVRQALQQVLAVA